MHWRKAMAATLIATGGLAAIPALSVGAAGAPPSAAYSFDAAAGGMAADDSGNGHDASLVAGATTTAGRTGGGLALDGGSARAVTADAVSLGSNFTIEAWVRPTSTSGYRTVASVGESRDFYVLDGGLFLYDGRADRSLRGGIAAGQWSHVAVTSDGSTVRGYVNGVLTGSASSTLGSVTAPLTIGSWASGAGATDFFGGTMDDVRLYDRALTAGEVSADMSTPVTAGGSPATTAPATSTTTTTVAPTTTPPSTTTTVAPTTTTTVPSTTNRSLRFYGTGDGGIDRVRIPLTPSKSVNLGQDITIEWWMKVAGPLTSGSCGSYNDAWIYGNIVFDRDVFGAGDYGDYGISLFSGGVIGFGVARGSNGTTACSTIGVADGQWHHVAVTRSGSSGKLAIFIDGQARGTANGPTGDISYRQGRSSGYPNDPYLVLGAEKHDAGAQFPSYPGWLDEIRISDSVRYSQAFTPVDGPLADDAATVALYHADEGSGTTLGDAAGANSGTLMVGGPSNGPTWSADVPW